MISKIHRFHGHNSVRGVYQKGQSVRGPLWTMKAAPSRRGDYRLAIVVSKKVSKSAVVRNRIRRRLYEAARTTGLIAQPIDVVITVFSEQVVDVPTTELVDILTTQLKQLTKTTEA